MIDDFEKYLRQAQRQMDKTNLMFEKRLAKMYKAAYIQANQELAELYARLGDKMSLPDAQKYNRLPSLLKSIEDEYKALTGKSLKLGIESSATNFVGAAYGYEWAADMAIGVRPSWGVLPVDAIRASVYSEQSGLNIVKTFKKNYLQSLSDIQAAITRGIATGTGYRETARQLKQAFNKGLWQALRVVQTEAGRNYTEGHLNSHDRAIEAGINVVATWSAARDGDVRTSHQTADGQAADKNGLFHYAGIETRGPGLSGIASDVINCRCRLLDRIDGLPPEVMRVKGIKDTIPYQTYTDYYGIETKNKISQALQ